MHEKLLIKYNRDIEKIHPLQLGDWIDLRVGEDTTIRAGEN